MAKYPNEKAMLNEISSLGFLKHATIDKLHYSKRPLPPDVVNVILKWLPKIYEEHIGSGEHLIRALVFTETDFDPQTIIKLFEDSDYNSSLKWTMAYVLSISRVGDISNYIRDQLFNKSTNFEREGFIYSFEINANFSSKKELMTALKKIFYEYIFFQSIFLLFKKYGQIEDIPFLMDQLKVVDKKKGKEIEKLIESIKKRKREPVFPKKEKFIT